MPALQILATIRLLLAYTNTARTVQDMTTPATPVQVMIFPTMTITAYDLDKDSRITITLDGDCISLIDHLPQIVKDALNSM